MDRRCHAQLVRTPALPCSRTTVSAARVCRARTALAAVQMSVDRVRRGIIAQPARSPPISTLAQPVTGLRALRCTRSASARSAMWASTVCRDPAPRLTVPRGDTHRPTAPQPTQTALCAPLGTTVLWAALRRLSAALGTTRQPVRLPVLFVQQAPTVAAIPPPARTSSPTAVHGRSPATRPGSASKACTAPRECSAHPTTCATLVRRDITAQLACRHPQHVRLVATTARLAEQRWRNAQ